jgi:hypothetical protein
MNAAQSPVSGRHHRRPADPLRDAVAALLAECGVNSREPITPQIQALPESLQRTFNRRWDELPGTEDERLQALLLIRGEPDRPPAIPFPPPLRQTTRFVNAEGKPVRLTGAPLTDGGMEYEGKIASVEEQNGRLVITMIITQGETEVIEDGTDPYAAVRKGG